jgi:nucleoside-diphosphate-sugar epimerase
LSPAWTQVEQVVVDRAELDAAGTFADLVVDLDPDVVIDLVCFTIDSARSLVEGLRNRVGHLIHCGSIWKHGLSAKVPISETDQSAPVGEYGTQKAAIAKLLRDETGRGGLPTTSIHPGHISGPGWPVINPVGNTDPSVWQRLAAGADLTIPGLGSELMAHVHADDVAQAFALAVENLGRVSGEEFYITAASALTVRGYARTAARWFGQEVSLRSVSWDEFRATTTTDYCQASWDHLVRSHHMSVAKAERILGYRPAYTPEEAARQAVASLIADGSLRVENPMLNASTPTF